jgi:hypothetical protein
MGNQIDLNKFNALISQASDTIMCNSECKKERESEKLKKSYLNAQTNLDSASNQVQVAQKNYVTFTQGNNAYNELFENQLEQKAEAISNNFNEIFNTESNKVKSQINSYTGLLLNFNNILDLLEQYTTENIKLSKELKIETSDVLTNERKTFYEDQKIDGLNFYYFYFLVSIYVIFVICFAVFSLIYPSQTNWKVRFAIFIGLIALPFLSTWILGIVIYLIYEAYNLLPKNVYK